MTKLAVDNMALFLQYDKKMHKNIAVNLHGNTSYNKYLQYLTVLHLLNQKIINVIIFITEFLRVPETIYIPFHPKCLLLWYSKLTYRLLMYTLMAFCQQFLHTLSKVMGKGKHLFAQLALLKPQGLPYCCTDMMDNSCMPIQHTYYTSLSGLHFMENGIVCSC